MSKRKKTFAPLRYVGYEAIVGVPARDLTSEEHERYAESIAATYAATGRVLYEVVSDENVDAPPVEGALGDTDTVGEGS
jgi:hypothetical protein